MTTSQNNSTRQALVAALASIVVMVAASPTFRDSELPSFVLGSEAGIDVFVTPLAVDG